MLMKSRLDKLENTFKSYSIKNYSVKFAIIDDDKSIIKVIDYNTLQEVDAKPDYYIPKVFEHAITKPRRITILKGGRGSGKTTVASAIAVAEMIKRKQTVLCLREIQNSIRDSSYSEIKKRIQELDISSYFSLTQHEMLFRGSNCIFRGMLRNLTNLKSISGVGHGWGEEAQSFSEESIHYAIPTIRMEDSRIVLTLNEKHEDDPINRLYDLNECGDYYIDDHKLIIHANYDSNPYFPEVLELDRIKQKESDIELYRWIWEGRPLKYSDEKVIAHKIEVVKHIDIPFRKDDFLYGLDFGYSVDPSALVKVAYQEEVLYIFAEAYGKKVELTDYDDFLSPVVEKGYDIIRCDDARPDIISHLCTDGYLAIKSGKKKGDREKFISWIRSLKSIRVMTSCTNCIRELMGYKFKKKPNGDITSEILEKDDHCVDAIRYALKGYY